MIKLWGRKNSINVQKVIWALEELGMPYDRIDAGMAFGVNNTPEFKIMNPNGLVPVIEHEGLILWESHAIVRYLATLDSQGILMPQALPTRADADRWMEWYSTTLWPNLRPVFWNLVRTAPEARDMALVNTSLQHLTNNFKIVDQLLASRDFLAGSRFSMADIPMGVAAFRWFEMPIDRPDLAHLNAWYQRLSERPAFKQHCQIPLT
ncbi:MAG: glutathione S-transferase [Betaproteobacteria bacterium]